jgi:hypothetical protein
MSREHPIEVRDMAAGEVVVGVEPAVEGLRHVEMPCVVTAVDQAAVPGLDQELDEKPQVDEERVGGRGPQGERDRGVVHVVRQLRDHVQRVRDLRSPASC